MSRLGGVNWWAGFPLWARPCFGLVGDCEGKSLLSAGTWGGEGEEQDGGGTLGSVSSLRSMEKKGWGQTLKALFSQATSWDSWHKQCSLRAQLEKCKEEVWGIYLLILMEKRQTSCRGKLNGSPAHLCLGGKQQEGAWKQLSPRGAKVVALTSGGLSGKGLQETMWDTPDSHQSNLRPPLGGEKTRSYSFTGESWWDVTINGPWLASLWDAGVQILKSLNVNFC